MTLGAFFGIQLQGTFVQLLLCNFKKQISGGDTTSKIFEYKSPKLLGNESQRAVDILFQIYTVVYGGFDKIIHI
jgi:hypothetical protein